VEKLLPTGSVDLVIRLNEERIRIFDEKCQRRFEFEYAAFHGAHSKPCVLEAQQQSAVIGIHFRPGGASAFFSLPLGELTNITVSAEDIWGRQLRELRERLLEARSPTTMFNLLEGALIRRLSPPVGEMQAIGHALDQFMASPTDVRVRQIRDATGYSPKRFIRLFENYVGLTPKIFCRVRRFQAVLEQIIAHRTVNWANVALDCGYFDQSHLIRDFRDFSGICPSQYRPLDPDRRNHIAVVM
jgi:AraC-like DNA-binding protein